MFSSKTLYNSAFAIGFLFIASYIGNNLSQHFQPKNDEYELIKKYLLNDSPLYGFNKPKLWIHSKYDINSRKWKSFYSRNSTDLNQPYIHLTIKTIINHCGNDFNICLIDDDTFSKLIPNWDVNISTLAEPQKTMMRTVGILQLIYFYGGMSLPNSFLCLKNLKPMYETGIQNKKPFVCENINRTTLVFKNTKPLLFLPDIYIIGAEKNSDTILELIKYIKDNNKSGFFVEEPNFLGKTSKWCLHAIQTEKMNLIGGEYVGVKTADQETILLENLMEEDYLNLNPNAFGIYIPENEILTRPKFQWFAVMPVEDILKTNCIISKYIASSIVDSSDSYNSSNVSSENKSVISI